MRVQSGGAKHQATNTTKSVDSDLNSRPADSKKGGVSKRRFAVVKSKSNDNIDAQCQPDANDLHFKVYVRSL